MHRNCVTDPLTRQWWRDYRKADNPLGLSFVEYVAHRVASLGPRVTYTDAPDLPWYVSSCGHMHPWGESCNAVTVTQ